MDDLRRIIRDLLVFAILAFSIALLGGCSSSRSVTGRSVTDSVVMRYKTVWRDSVRLRDSTVISHATRTRDSVVVRVDAATGDVVGKDSWHWTYSDNNHREVTERTNTAFKADSVASTALKRDVRTDIGRGGEPCVTGEKTGFWRIWLAGMAAGMLLMAAGWLVWKRLW